MRRGTSGMMSPWGSRSTPVIVRGLVLSNVVTLFLLAVSFFATPTTHPDIPASAASSSISFSRPAAAATSTSTFLVVVPYVSSRVDLVERALETWASISPCDASAATVSPSEIVFYANAFSPDAESMIRSAFSRLRLKELSCISATSPRFANAGLVPGSPEDIYPRGPNNMFWRLWFGGGNGRSTSTAATSSLLPFLAGASAFLYLEPDVRPIRSGWLENVRREFFAVPSTWMMGSLPRTVGDASSASSSSSSDDSPASTLRRISQFPSYRFHLNGNAVYASSSSAFREFLARVYVWTVKSREPTTGGYDTDIFQYLVKRWDVARETLHHFRLTDTIQNHYRSPVSPFALEAFRERYPQVALVHWSGRWDTFLSRASASACAELGGSALVLGEGDGRKVACWGGGGDGRGGISIPSSSSSSSPGSTSSLVVYSFGSNGEDSFERDVASKLCRDTACDIHIFDPTSRPLGSAYGAVFHSVGIGARDRDNVVLCRFDRCSEGATVSGVSIRTLPTIAYSLGHKWIDILKIDVEGAEYDSFLGDEEDDDDEAKTTRALVREFLANRVGQILMEVHWRDFRTPELASFLEGTCGFRLWRVEVNEMYRRGAEFVFVKGVGV